MSELEADNPVHPGAIITLSAALMAVGLVMVTSATAPLDRSLVEVSFWRTTFGRQVIFALVGLLLMVTVSRVAVPFLARPTTQKWIPGLVFALALAGLVAAFIPGLASSRHGSQRWLQVAPAWVGIGFQPSEFAKLALVGFLAMWLARPKIEVRDFRRGFLPAALAAGVFVLLVGKADFSTAVLLAGVAFMMLLVAGCRVRHLAVLGGLGVVAFGVLLVAAPYRMARLTAHQTFWDDPMGAGYQPLQSLTTIASGGWFGTGLGAGVQKYGYLPESHSDFVFAMVCEEMGLLGGGLVIALFCGFVWLGLRTMWSAPTMFERLLAFGLTACIGMQAAMNIAVVTVVTPTTGIPLPLISAGGSGLLTFSLAIGLLAAIAARSRPPARIDGEEGLAW